MKRNYINIKLDDFENQRVENIKLIAGNNKAGVLIVMSMILFLKLLSSFNTKIQFSFPNYQFIICYSTS